MTAINTGKEMKRDGAFDSKTGISGVGSVVMVKFSAQPLR